MFTSAVQRVIRYNRIHEEKAWVSKSRWYGQRESTYLKQKKTKRGEEQLVDVQFATYANLHAGAEGRTGIFYRKIAVSAEIKKNWD